jgi:hypothetical protein
MPWAVQQPTCVSTQPTLCVIGMLRVERTFNAKGCKTGNLSLCWLRTERRGRSTGSTRPDAKDVRGRGNASYHRQGPPPSRGCPRAPRVRWRPNRDLERARDAGQASQPGGCEFRAFAHLEQPYVIASPRITALRPSSTSSPRTGRLDDRDAGSRADFHPPSRCAKHATQPKRRACLMRETHESHLFHPRQVPRHGAAAARPVSSSLRASWVTDPALPCDQSASPGEKGCLSGTEAASVPLSVLRASHATESWSTENLPERVHDDGCLCQTSPKQQTELRRMHGTGEYSINDLAELFSIGGADPSPTSLGGRALL